MSIVNFSLPKTLEQRISVAIKEKGFASKAEFFRFAAVHFLDVVQKPFASEDERMGYLSGLVAREIRERFGGKKISSARDQLSDT